MKKLCAALGLLLATTCAATDAPLLPQRVADTLQQRIDAGEYPALVIAVVDGDSSAVYTYGKLDQGKPLDGDTVFEIGSITKTFTATLLAQQVTTGKLQLDQPVATLLPGFSIPSRDGKAVTLGNLAMQNSGLPRLPSNLRPADAMDPYADYSPAKLKAFLSSYTLPRDPGARYEYSNLGVGLLGYALGVHAGTSYEQLLQQQVLQPLGMRHSSTVQTDAMHATMAPGHDATGKPMGNWHIDALAGAGSLVSSGNDMLRYLKANMGRLPSTLYPAMQFAQAARADGPTPAERIGLVWMTHHDAAGDVIEHGGMTGGYASYLGFTADRRYGVVVLTNAAIAPEDLGRATLLADAPLAPAHKRISVPEKELDDYVGSYQLHPGFNIAVFHKGDQLMSQGTGQDEFPVYASAKDEFFAAVADISLSFKRDEHGKVTSVVVHQHGDHVAPRVGAHMPEANDRPAITLDTATLGNYIGHYQLAPQAVIDVTLKNGQAFVQLTGQNAFPIYASARDKFFLRVVDAQIDFERDKDGKVVALVLHQNGMDQRAPRVAE
ncbi:serine hydrolase [Dyella kyungheensis]|uniref:Serine hydrolase n=1 Tax=Dyella kyungheensis TaxID=1242174 RepID=A0ABS2JZ09_9GAMM|nr:serine hydrolase [Dyella kyungheensis]MBM7123580.1 serine hydrolase [Dyella kyungheensis]